MPQHIWLGGDIFRVCEDCGAYQVKATGDWQPPVYPICPGNDDDDRRGIGRRKPNAPSGAPSRVLEVA